MDHSKIKICAFLISLLFVMINFRNSLALIREYGERCDNEDDICSDHRYACLPDGNDGSKCVCDRFHVYGGDILGCVQFVNTSFLILNSNITITDNEGILKNETESMVKIHASAGVFVFAWVIIGVVAVVIFCLYANYRDTLLEKEVFQLRTEEISRLRRASHRDRKSIVTNV